MHPTRLIALLIPTLWMVSSCADKEPATPDDTAPGDTDTAPDSDTDTDTDTDTDSSADPQPLELRILHINDHHSHLDAEDFGYDVSGLTLGATADAAGTPLSEVSVTFGGFPMLVSLFDQLEVEKDNVLRLHAGDAVAGTLYYTLFEGEADADMMGQVCFDAFTFGNHEFDNGDTSLAGFVDALNGGPCPPAVLSANLSPHDASPLNGRFEPYTLLEVGGQQVGVIGLTIAQKTMASSSPDEGTTLLDETETAQRFIDELRAEGIDKIILLTHYTHDAELELAAALTGVDVIVGGDSHTLLAGSGIADLGFNVVGEYPAETSNADGEPVCVVQAWEYAHLVGMLDVSFDENGVVTSCGGGVRVPIDGASLSYTYTDADGVESDLVLEGTDLELALDALTASGEIVVVEADPETSTLLETYSAQVDVLAATVIGTVAEDLCLERFPNQGRSTICDISETYEHGSQVGDVVARAFLEVTPTADLALQNAGGVRTDIAAGDFTIATGYTVLPFSNTLVTLELTGAEIVAVLEDALSNALDEGGSTGSYPYAAGLRYEIDASQAFGSRVSAVEVNPRFGGAWSAIEEDTLYTVVTNSFIASGQDGWDTFGVAYDAGLYLNTHTEYAQGLIDYVEALTEAGASLEGRTDEEASTQRYIGTDGCDHSASADCVSY